MVRGRISLSVSNEVRRSWEAIFLSFVLIRGVPPVIEWRNPRKGYTLEGANDVTFISTVA